MYVGPRPYPPFDAGQVSPAPDLVLAQLRPVLLSIGAGVLVVGGVLLTHLLAAQPACIDGLALFGP